MESKHINILLLGILLINLKEMRKENITQKFFEFMEKNKQNLIQED